MREYEIDADGDRLPPVDDQASVGERAELRALLTSLSERMAAFHDRAAARERVIDRLAGENDALRAGERALVLRPVAIDLQRLRNDLLRQAASLPADMTAAAMARLLKSFAFSAEQTLERCGVRVIRPEVGERFDPAHHQASATDPAPAPEFDGAIASALADGYLDVATGRAMTAAAVRVFRWLPGQPGPGPSDAEEPSGSANPSTDPAAPPAVGEPR